MDEPLITEPGPFWRRHAGTGTEDAQGGHRRAWLITAIAVTVAAIVVVGAAVRLPYYTLAPGDALAVDDLVEIDGARTYEPDGDVLLLFVRQRARVNLWRWVQAAIDPDIDLFREEAFTGGHSPAELRAAARADMAQSQIAAKKVALEALGYEVPPASGGVVVLALLPGRPAEEVLRPEDEILRADGRRIERSQDLGRVVDQHEAGESVELLISRDQRTRTVEVEVALDDQGERIIGVYVLRRYSFPVRIDIDTKSIGGPSAGLAMTLAIIDELSEGELTGGLDVAVTGTIAEDGSVGEVGGVGQKTVAARAAGADVFLVPASEVEEAADRAGGLRVVGVEDLDDALRALREAGGDTVPALAS